MQLVLERAVLCAGLHASHVRKPFRSLGCNCQVVPSACSVPLMAVGCGCRARSCCERSWRGRQRRWMRCGATSTQPTLAELLSSRRPGRGAPGSSLHKQSCSRAAMFWPFVSGLQSLLLCRACTPCKMRSKPCPNPARQNGLGRQRHTSLGSSSDPFL